MWGLRKYSFHNKFLVAVHFSDLATFKAIFIRLAFLVPLPNYMISTFSSALQEKSLDIKANLSNYSRVAAPSRYYCNETQRIFILVGLWLPIWVLTRGVSSQKYHIGLKSFISYFFPFYNHITKKKSEEAAQSYC